jgi:hypothetical protein
MLAPGTVLTPESDGTAIEITNGEPIKIRVKALFRLVEVAWSAVDKKKLKPRTIKLPKQPIDFTGASPSFPVASSGCPAVPKIREMWPQGAEAA